jgi:hypothetical protein
VIDVTIVASGFHVGSILRIRSKHLATGLPDSWLEIKELAATAGARPADLPQAFTHLALISAAGNLDHQLG